MADKFDSFSKHLATKQTRRGALKFLGAGIFGAALGALFTNQADAGRRNPRNPRTGNRWFRRDDNEGNMTVTVE